MENQKFTFTVYPANDKVNYFDIVVYWLSQGKITKEWLEQLVLLELITYFVK